MENVRWPNALISLDMFDDVTDAQREVVRRIAEVFGGQVDVDGGVGQDGAWQQAGVQAPRSVWGSGHGNEHAVRHALVLQRRCSQSDSEGLHRWNVTVQHHGHGQERGTSLCDVFDRGRGRPRDVA